MVDEVTTVAMAGAVPVNAMFALGWRLVYKIAVP